MSAIREHRTADCEDDFYAWTQEQARMLRSLRLSKATLPAGIDLDHIAEEIEDMGRSDLRSARRLMLNAIVHVLKICSAPGKAPEKHWKSEANGFLLQLWDDEYAPSMRQRLDIEKIWAGARQQAEFELEEYGDKLIANLPSGCPLSIEELTGGPPDVEALISKVLLASYLVER